MSNSLLIGLDTHRKSHTVSWMDSQGNEIRPRTVIPNHRPGAEQFAQQIADTIVANDFDRVQVAAEATGWYWWHVFQSLSEADCLAAVPLELYPLNPRLTASFKRTYGDLDHTDTIDAFVVADRLRMARDLPPVYDYARLQLPLRCLTRYRQHLVQSLVREKSYFLAVLYLKASEYTRLKPFSNMFGKTSQALIEEFASIEALADEPFDDLITFIEAKSKGHMPNPARNAALVQQVAAESYPLPPDMLPVVNLILSFSGQRIRSTQHTLKRLDTAITNQLAAIPHSLHTIPGMGLVYSAGIIAELGNLSRFDDDDAKVASYAGLKWHRHQSAEFVADHTPLTRKGNRYLRYYFCEAANSVRLHDAQYKAYYLKKFAEVRSHQHKRAIVLTARKLVRLVVRLLTTGQDYQPGRC
jgi:transposase